MKSTRAKARLNPKTGQYLSGKLTLFAPGLTYVGSLSALGVATCCVLPMTMMLFGLGGSWLAVFGKIAAASFYVLAIATVILLAAWMISYRRGSLVHLKGWLAGSTTLTAIAWVIVFNEARINDFLITLM